MAEEERRILAEAQSILNESWSIAVELGPHAVAVLGDARFYGPTLIVRFNPNLTMEQAGAIATRIINEVKGLSRVLAEISPENPLAPE